MTPMLMTALFVAIGLYIRGARNARRSHLRALAVIRKCRQRRDEWVERASIVCDEMLNESARAEALNDELRAYRLEDDERNAVRGAVEKSLRERFN